MFYTKRIREKYSAKIWQQKMWRYSCSATFQEVIVVKAWIKGSSANFTSIIKRTYANLLTSISNENITNHWLSGDFTGNISSLIRLNSLRGENDGHFYYQI